MDENESIITKAAKDFKAKSGAVIQRLNRVCGDSARQYPAEYVEVERREAMAELATLESAMLGTAGQAHERELAVADEIYAKDPRDDSAVMADELQIARLRAVTVLPHGTQRLKTRPLLTTHVPSRPTLACCRTASSRRRWRSKP